jgi:hypothetical protein
MPRGVWEYRTTKKSRPGWLAFESHRLTAKRRGIPFLFDYDAWWAWWQVDGRWAQRGRGANKLCMARKGDAGPYSPENVYCATNTQNGRDAVFPGSSAASAEALRKLVGTEILRRPHLAVRGDGHPRSRAVLTPLGRFGSGALAAEAHGIDRSTATARARKGTNGWSYETHQP